MLLTQFKKKWWWSYDFTFHQKLMSYQDGHLQKGNRFISYMYSISFFDLLYKSDTAGNILVKGKKSRDKTYTILLFSDLLYGNSQTYLE